MPGRNIHRLRVIIQNFYRHAQPQSLQARLCYHQQSGSREPDNDPAGMERILKTPQLVCELQMKHALSSKGF